MRSKAFDLWIAQAATLTRAQRGKALDALRPAARGPRPARPGPPPLPPILREALERRPPCPACGTPDPRPWGVRQGLQRWRCTPCGRTFNALTGTPLARLRRKDRWLAFEDALRCGETVHGSAATCGVAPGTAFRWRHRFLAGPAGDQATAFHTLVEADETFFRFSEKGSRTLRRPPAARGGPEPDRARRRPLVAVATFLERGGGGVRELVLRSFRASRLVGALAFALAPEAVLCTDGSATYRKFAKAVGVRHEAVDLAKGVRTRGAFHVQGVNRWHASLKSWITRFHGVATRYLARYLGWHRLLEGRKAILQPGELIQVAVGKKRFQPLAMK